MSDEIANKPKQRGNPAWVKGGKSPNPSGRPADLGAFRELCRSHSPAAVQALVQALGNGDTASVAAARVLLEYGYGKPQSSPEDLEAAKAVVSITQLTREEMLAVARGEAEGDE